MIVNATYRGQTIVGWPHSPATSTRPTYRAGSFYPGPAKCKSVKHRLSQQKSRQACKPDGIFCKQIIAC
ncbi:hypothetical protein TH25_01850 [Thalassospira profundimaris]|uniref:Uncharacterized protein n=1 Tax=Thalassospira profundimaris TaxID=502049 RepID=A0A367XKB4_9PROT|nr:hypothetical protein TH25_01850 [Thalassospira profundimaris]